MCSHVCLQSVLFTITLVTLLEGALKWFIMHVDFCMTPQMSFTDEPLLTIWAFERFIVSL